MIPADTVTIRNECCCGVGNLSARYDNNVTHNDLEDEITRHKTEFQACLLRNALETRQETKNNGKEHHENCESDGGKDTLAKQNVEHSVSCREKFAHRNDTQNRAR